MKKGFRVLLMIGLVSTVALTSCTEEEEDPIVPTPTDSSAVLIQYSDTGIIWNFQGPNKGAYDLVGDAEVGATGSNTIKDLVDQSTVDSGGVVFPKTWGTANGCLFVKASATFDYDSVTVNKAKAAFDAGTSTSATAELAVGDVYVVKNTRFANDYVVVKVLQVNVTLDDNLDNIRFNYKK